NVMSRSNTLDLLGFLPILCRNQAEATPVREWPERFPDGTLRGWRGQGQEGISCGEREFLLQPLYIQAQTPMFDCHPAPGDTGERGNILFCEITTFIA